MFLRDLGPETGRAVLCVHGQVFDGAVFKPLADRLARHCRVIVPDLPGHGCTPLTTMYSLEHVQAEMRAALEERGIACVSVIGYSLGTYHALAVALAGGVQVDRLVLLGALAGIGDEEKVMLDGFAQHLGNGGDLATAFLGMAVPRHWANSHPADMQRLVDAVSQARRDTLLAELSEMARMRDLRPLLGQVRSPTLVRVGALDQNTPAAWGEAIAAAIPGATFQLVPDVGHLYTVQDPDGTADAVEKFLLG